MPRIELKPFWQTSDNETAKLYHGDVISVLKRMPAKSAQCVVTSPPYWGLRDYGVDGQLGSEKTPQEFVQKMMDVFTEVYRVLRDDGTLWLNLGDTYASGEVGRKDRKDGTRFDDPQTGRIVTEGKGFGEARQTIKLKTGIASGNLVGIPWMVAFALRDAGWILRQDIIWSKPAPMPESIKNRCTKAHEYIFLMTKNRQYYCDMELIKEDSVDPESLNGRRKRNQDKFVQAGIKSETRDGFSKTPEGKTYETKNKRSVWPVESFNDLVNFLREKHPQALKQFLDDNKLDVWSITSHSYSGAHFATFPPKLITPCVLAGCPEGGVVLDPFVGSGTTICVALQHGRKSWGIDLSEKYLKECAIPRIEGMIYQYPELHYLAGRERKAVTGLGVSLLNKKK